MPRGYVDFARQVVIWLAFYFGYLAVRGLVDRNPTKAVVNGLRVINFEQRTVSRYADSLHESDPCERARPSPYWNSEFTVIGFALLFVYLRRHERFARFRNTILLANVIGLVGYVVMPTAPPWMFPGRGFVDGVNHESGIGALANPYAAMPSLHAADALIVGVCLFVACRRWYVKALWALWPAWVWFCVMATANHYLFDVVAGIAVALLAMLVVSRVEVRRARLRAAPIANLL